MSHNENMRGRIIPAYAGSTRIPYARRPRTRDHPRIRGEHSDAAVASLAGKGSSPHTRGARIKLGGERVDAGIIPAYAGSTCHPRGICKGAWDHPRIRGEHGKLGAPLILQPGSSPHTRGAPHGWLGACAPTGIIPAYAGSTGRPLRSGQPLRDHPRIRGEHIANVSSGPDFQGSSPHTRGAPDADEVHPRCDGIIPAYAGSTGRPPRSVTTPRDHPRIRGEHPP